MTLEWLAKELRSRDEYLFLTHVKPDGDTIGSAAALCLLLRQMKKRAFVASNEDMTPRYAQFTRGLEPPGGFEPGAVIAVDIADESMLPPSAARFKGKIDICVDHHPSNKRFAAHTLLHANASATGEIIWQIARELGLEPCERALAALYLAVATDTGCFRYSNTTPLSHIIAAAAIDGGVDFHAINYEFFNKKTKARFDVEKALLSGLLFEGGGKVAGASLTREYIDSVGATEDDLDNLSSLIINLEGLMCGVLAVEQKNGGGTKLSVRTRAPLNASEICGAFGGGGHARAAGCTLMSGVDDALGTVLRAAANALEGAAGEHV